MAMGKTAVVAEAAVRATAEAEAQPCVRRLCPAFKVPSALPRQSEHHSSGASCHAGPTAAPPPAVHMHVMRPLGLSSSESSRSSKMAEEGASSCALLLGALLGGHSSGRMSIWSDDPRAAASAAAALLGVLSRFC